MPKYPLGDGRYRWTRVVYVVDLELDVCSASSFRCGGDCQGRPIYVGETALEPEERLAQHRAGIRSSKWARRFAIALNPALTADLREFESVEESRAAEKQVSAELRAEGYCVFGGH